MMGQRIIPLFPSFSTPIRPTGLSVLGRAGDVVPIATPAPALLRLSTVTRMPGTVDVAGQLTGSQPAGMKAIADPVGNVYVAQPSVFGTGGIAGLVADSTNAQYAGGVASTCYAGVATPVGRNVAQFPCRQCRLM